MAFIGALLLLAIVELRLKVGSLEGVHTLSRTVNFFPFKPFASFPAALKQGNFRFVIGLP